MTSPSNNLLAEAAKFTPEELDLINSTAESLIPHDPRPIVLLAIASHLIGIVIRGSDGTLSKDLVVDLVAKGVEAEPEKDPLFAEAVHAVRKYRYSHVINPGLLIWSLNITFARASALIEQLQVAGIISSKGRGGKRTVV